LQRQVSSELSIHFGGYTIRENIRPQWLYGDYGERLELDFLIEELDIAIEVQGKQHYVYTPHFHNSRDAFQKQVRRDQRKKEICYSAGLMLLEVSSPSEIPSIMRTIKWESDKAESLRTSSNGYDNFDERWQRKLEMALKHLRKRVNKQEWHRFATGRPHYTRVQQWVDHYGIQIFQVVYPHTAQELITCLKKFETRWNVHKSQGKTPAQKRQRRRAKNRNRARKTLKIARTNNPANFWVWGGKDIHYLTINNAEITCDCNGFIDGGTDYCSHIAKLDLLLYHNEGDLQDIAYE
jgi:hypothetical protein